MERALCRLVCLTALVVCLAATSVADADPHLLPLAPTTGKKSIIPLAVIKDIHRVRPGMTRADLDWLFTLDSGFYIVTPRFYIYRYAGASIALADAAGKPILDKVTHKPLLIGQAIKIDVQFRPATAGGWGTAVEDGIGRRFNDPAGRPDDVIVSVSEPYVGFENDN